MLSRVAQNIYWMARYIERVENTARLVNVTANLLLDLPQAARFGWEPLLIITGSWSAFKERYDEPDEASVVRFLLADKRNPSSILASLIAARENLRTTRDAVPQAAWEQINDILIYAHQHVERGITRRGRYPFLKQVILSTQQLTGLLAGTMSHTSAYDFVRLGRNLERADMTTRIIDVRTANLLGHRESEGVDPFDGIQWMSLLKSMNAYQMYRQQVRLRVRGPDVLRFLLQDPLFPRAVRHCLEAMAECLEKLPHNGPPLTALSNLQQTVAGAQIAELAQQGLHEFMDQLQIGLGEMHNQIMATYFPAMEQLPVVETEPQTQTQTQTQP